LIAETAHLNLDCFPTGVLAQREMENWRSPLAKYTAFFGGQLGEHRTTSVATAELGGG
jgi:hypothetical protein